MAAEVYDVSSVRTLSEGITGYEAKTTSLYGVVTGLSEGNLYIDIDTDSHNVISLTGEEDAPKEYMLATGMLSSAYEGIVWEQLTGYKGVSTISIFAQAKEENIDILLISQENLSTEIEKLNTDEITKKNVKNAVDSGMTVAIPAENVTIYDWSEWWSCAKRENPQKRTFLGVHFTIHKVELIFLQCNNSKSV